MRRLLLAVALAAVAGLVPSAGGAHSPNPTANCSIIGDEAELSVVGVAGPIHVDLDGPGVWEESNGWPGLQVHGHTCRPSSDADPIAVPSDTHLL